MCYIEVLTRVLKCRDVVCQCSFSHIGAYACGRGRDMYAHAVRTLVQQIGLRLLWQDVLSGHSRTPNERRVPSIGLYQLCLGNRGSERALSIMPARSR